jgi:hypothetical protein
MSDRLGKRRRDPNQLAKLIVDIVLIGYSTTRRFVNTSGN